MTLLNGYISGQQYVGETECYVCRFPSVAERIIISASRFPEYMRNAYSNGERVDLNVEVYATEYNDTLRLAYKILQGGDFLDSVWTVVTSFLTGIFQAIAAFITGVLGNDVLSGFVIGIPVFFLISGFVMSIFGKRMIRSRGRRR